MAKRKKNKFSFLLGCEKYCEPTRNIYINKTAFQVGDYKKYLKEGTQTEVVSENINVREGKGTVLKVLDRITTHQRCMQQQLLKQSSFQREKNICKLLRELVNKLNKNGILPS